MTASHAREHLSSGVHRRYSKSVLQGPFCSSSMAGPVASIDIEDPQQSLSAEPVRIDPLHHPCYLTLFQMSVEDMLSTRGPLSDMHSTLCTAVPPSNPDVEPLSSSENTFLDPYTSCTAGGSHIDTTVCNSWVDFMHIDDNHGVDEQLDIAASNYSFGEDQDYLFSNKNISGEAHAGELNIDLDGEFVLLLPFLVTEHF